MCLSYRREGAGRGLQPWTCPPSWEKKKEKKKKVGLITVFPSLSILDFDIESFLEVWRRQSAEGVARRRSTGDGRK